MTDELRAELEAIQERADQASAAPWEPGDVYGLVRPTKIDSYLDPEKHKEAQEQIQRNVEFIANARNDVPQLIAALKAVTKVLDLASSEAVGRSRAIRMTYSEGYADGMDAANTLAQDAITAALTKMEDDV